MKIKLVVGDRELIGSILPRWYGFAYRQWDQRRTVLCIIPFNLVLRYSVKVYWIMYRWLKSDGWESMLDEAYRRGYNDGNTTREHHYDRLARILQGKEDI